MSNWDDIRALLERYYEGDTTLTEENSIKGALSSTPNLPADLLAEAKILGWYCSEQSIKHPKSISGILEALPITEDSIKPINNKPYTTRTTATILWPALWKVAAALAILVLGYGIGRINTPNPAATGIASNANLASTEIIALRQEVEAVKQMLTSNSTSGERLQLVNNAAQLPPNQVSNELLLALIQTLHFDDNVNVRLAAAEALMQYQNNPIVRQALARSLSLQTDPNIQLLLIAGLTTMKEKAVVPVMEEMLKTDSLQPVVKQQIQESIAILL